MKIVSPDIIHKTDAGGVKLNIKDEKEARIAYQEIIFEAKKYNKEAQIFGVITYSMIPKATEIIIGIMKDPHFGPVIMFRLGGIFVEILKGARGEASKDIEAIKILLMKISQLSLENSEIKEIDLNPVFVFEKGLQVIDARMIL